MMCRTLVLLLAMTAIFGGCTSEDAPKASHFEHDHEVAPHWPAGLADAVAKIRHRLDDTGSNAGEIQRQRDQLVDIVNWIPEIAADTDLSEQAWIPIDNAAASLTANLRASGNELSPSNRKQAAALCDLIDQALAKSARQVASSKGAFQ
ncbi:hypothetical protein [Stieleria mannarensis]|uniref:hypothetical protein n=1 Tax=Stieleria mannarensis TaxID=2755585 RepID=UPI0016047B10|nr:hypothetical protein [Rhodopirellula sp. JC639]